MARELAQASVDDRTRRSEGDEPAEPQDSAVRPNVSVTLTGSFAMRYRSNVYETRRDRVGSAYVDPELLLFARRAFEMDPRFRLGVGAYVNQQAYARREARDAGFTLLRGIAEADFLDEAWRVAIRYAPSATFEPRDQALDYTAHDARLRVSRDVVLGGFDRFVLTPQLTLLRREASRSSRRKSEFVPALLWDVRIADSWSLEGEASATYAAYDIDADGIRRRETTLRLEPRLTYAPSGANYSASFMIGVGRRFSNVPDQRGFYWEAGPGGDAKATFRVRF